MASLSQCLTSALGLGWALGPACWNWVTEVRWTRPWAADWAQASRTLECGLGGGRSPHRGHQGQGFTAGCREPSPAFTSALPWGDPPGKAPCLCSSSPIPFLEKSG